jgi:hypothetical protein
MTEAFSWREVVMDIDGGTIQVTADPTGMRG